MNINEKVDLYSLDADELSAFVKSIGEPAFRAKQIASWLPLGTPIDEMTNLSKALREKLAASSLDTLPRVEEKLVSKIDGTVKYLFSLYDGSCIESVFMRYKHGNTLCISSQVGCRMGCKFCASTIGGKVRDLLPSELLGQIIAAQRDTGERISNIVMMGIGEPLDNFDNVVKFLRLVNREDGLNIGYRHISLSTCGVVPKIYDLAKVDLPITLSISLHAANDEKRSAIMPVNNKWNVETLLSTCRKYTQVTSRRISFEYAMISGVNDSDECAHELGRKLRGMLCHVNLIPVNSVKERNYKKSSDNRINEFIKILEKYRIKW